LHILGVQDVDVYSRSTGDVPPSLYPTLSYQPGRNLLPGNGHWRRLHAADTVLWSVGLDMQDDSSLAKLMYLWVTFRLYHQMGLNVWCLFQGAGPLSTKPGRWLASSVLKEVDLFVARDPGTHTLINRISPGINSVLAHDAIFLPGFEDDLSKMIPNELNYADGIFSGGDGPVVGINIRQWFHFVSSILPYQFSQGAYKQRSQEKMSQLIRSSISLIRLLRVREKARVVLISAYQPEIVPWEDDLPWLTQVKAAFKDDEDVLLIDGPISMPLYYALMSRLDLMIGMRLHSSLVSLRFGVPSLNLGYTLKGADILRHLGLPEYVADLQTFMDTPETLYDRAVSLLQNSSTERGKVGNMVARAIGLNMDILKSLVVKE
jgi:polysaccharide pyruvyl transferase WcaK-like protein